MVSPFLGRFIFKAVHSALTANAEQVCKQAAIPKLPRNTRLNPLSAADSSLTHFTATRCTRPWRQRSLLAPRFPRRSRRRTFSSAVVGCGRQGTTSSPPSTATILYIIACQIARHFLPPPAFCCRKGVFIFILKGNG